jgi:hypothetical protein
MEHIQRDYLRRLLRAVEKGDRTPEHAADVIISLINENYDLKQPEEHEPEPHEHPHHGC